MTTRDEARRMIGYHVLAADDEDIGTVDEVYLDDRTHDPEFVSVKGGLFGMRERLVPLQGSRVAEDRLRVPFDKQMVKDAPNTSSGRNITPQESQDIYRHYGITRGDLPQQNRGPSGQGQGTPGDQMAAGGQDTTQATQDTQDAPGTPGTAPMAAAGGAAGGTAAAGMGAADRTDTDRPAHTDTDRPERMDADRPERMDADRPGRMDTGQAGRMDADQAGRMDTGQAGRMDRPGRMDAAGTRADMADAGGQDPDEVVVTRSEEQMHVGTERQESDRVHVQKRVESEQVERTVPVSHEEVRVEREPITDADRARGDIAEDDQEMILHEERPVVWTESVPVERVRISKDEVQDEQTVRGEVRKEQVDVTREHDDERDEGPSPT